MLLSLLLSRSPSQSIPPPPPLRRLHYHHHHHYAVSPNMNYLEGMGITQAGVDLLLANITQDALWNSESIIENVGYANRGTAMNNMKRKKFIYCVIGFPDAIGLTFLHGRPIVNPIPPDTDIPYRCRRRICFMTPLNALMWLIGSNTLKSRTLYNALSRTFLTLDRAAVLSDIQAIHPPADLKPTTTSAVDAPTLPLIVHSNPQAVPSSSSSSTLQPYDIPRDILSRDTHPAYIRAHTKSPLHFIFGSSKTRAITPSFSHIQPLRLVNDVPLPPRKRRLFSYTQALKKREK